MKKFKSFKPEKRLKKRVEAPGGVSLKKLVERADANLEAYKPKAVAGVGDKIGEVERMVMTLNDEPGFSEKLHRLANEIYAEAGTFGLPSVSKAAFSLCELVTRARSDLKPQRKRLLVHVLTLRLFKSYADKLPQEAQDALLDSLNDLVQKLPPLPPPAKRKGAGPMSGSEAGSATKDAGAKPTLAA